MKYSDLVELYKKLDSTTKRLEKTYYISIFLSKTKIEDLEQVLLLIEGRLFPHWDPREIGVSSRLILKALNKATGIDTEKIEKEWKKLGDLGDVAAELVKKKKQHTLFSQQLSVKKVFDNLRKLVEFEGEGTVDRKLQLIAELLTSATPDEAKYITRTVLGEMRIGVGEGSLRDAVVWSSSPKVIGIFHRCDSCKEYVPSSSELKCPSCEKPLKKKFSEDIKEFMEHFKKTSSIKILEIEKADELENKNLGNYDFIISKDEETARAAYNYFVSLVQEGLDLSNDFGIVAEVIRKHGPKGLSKIDLKVGIPIKVMLAQKVADMEQGFERIGTPLQIEQKYDGFRIQIHKDGEKVMLFTRHLENVTAQFPEVVSYVKEFVNAKNCILDSEAVGFDPKTNKYRPFQEVSQRIKRKYDIEQTAKELPVEVNVFDVMEYNDKNMISAPFKERTQLLDKIIKNHKRKLVKATTIETSQIKDANKFYAESLKAGNEGIMLKTLDAPYKPGSRVGFMVKLKPTMETLDLVITGAEWGEGKRSSWLSSFAVSCIDKNGNFKELGQVGTGIKEKPEEGVSFDEMTKLLKPLIIKEEGKTVKVKPKIVIEVKYEEIQKSPTYNSGFALRFPRLVRLREDRSADDASTLEIVEEFYENQRKGTRKGMM
ncbi:MAG: ATP-dependent DNA ligase [Nanoarchaeota archaeon]|nr:ATP-dependent DNA ligase [Nanoarchaeota archaeon]